MQRSGSPKLDPSVALNIQGGGVSPAKSVAPPSRYGMPPPHHTHPQQISAAAFWQMVVSPSPLSPFSRNKALLCLGTVLSLATLFLTIPLVDLSTLELLERERQCEAAIRLERGGDSTGRLCSEPPTDAAEADAAHPHLPPPPLRVVVAGMPRSMSTWLFNALRLLMAEVDPNLVSGWHTDLSHVVAAHRTPRGRTHTACCAVGAEGGVSLTTPRAGAIPEVLAEAHTCVSSEANPWFFLSQLQTSLLVKVHRAGEWRAFSGGANLTSQHPTGLHAVFASYRDLPEVTRSLRLQGNWTKYLDHSDIDEPAFCSGPLPKGRPFTEADWKNPASWANAAKVSARCFDAVRDAADPALFFPISFDSMRGSPAEALGRVAALLERVAPRSAAGEAVWLFPEEVQLRVLRRLRMLKQPPCEPGHIQVHPVTHLHRGHVHSHSPTPQELAGMEHIRIDPVCAAWRSRLGFA